MTEPTWRPLRNVEPRRLREARLQAHYAAQWVARTARAFVDSDPDDSHTNMRWADAMDGLVGNRTRYGWQLGLRLTDLTLMLLHDVAAVPPSLCGLDGRTDADVRQWLGNELAGREFDISALDTAAPYAIPAHPIAEGGKYDASGHAEGLRELAAWFANAACSLAPIQSEFNGSALRCWPHHFDLATLISFASKQANTTAYIGVGLEPGDHYYDEPYFYATVYPQPETAARPALPDVGHWHTQDFVGAIAPASKLLTHKNPQSECENFLRRAVEGAFALVR